MSLHADPHNCSSLLTLLVTFNCRFWHLTACEVKMPATTGKASYELCGATLIWERCVKLTELCGTSWSTSINSDRHLPLSSLGGKTEIKEWTNLTISTWPALEARCNGGSVFCGSPLVNMLLTSFDFKRSLTTWSQKKIPFP